MMIRMQEAMKACAIVTREASLANKQVELNEYNRAGNWFYASPVFFQPEKCFT